MSDPRCPACGVRLGEWCPHSCTACVGVGFGLGSPVPFSPETSMGWCGRCYGTQLEPYYSDRERSIYLGDCRTILPLIQAKVDLVLTDPPYEAEAHTLQRRVKRGGGIMAIEQLPFDPIDDATRRDVARLSAEKTRTWVLTFCQVEAAPKWREAWEAAGLRYMRTCIWVKPDGMPQYSGDRPGMGYETVLAMHQPGRSEWNGGGRHGVFIVNKNHGGRASLHPTEKPEALIRELTELFSNPGDLILDPFLGSGTTLRAAKDLGRRGLGIELEEKYCKIAAERLAQAVLPLAPRPAPTGQEKLPEGAA